ncbi:hypothetical protein Tcan_10454 [Toxocara canis]|uniref:Uncharacterized protein n=1 Tax=Toxocara canis TaxID=6265 RepID=A0A0B2VDB4_TOXCA|nr:hypothetical protein Tcan_10454 [Toxocara canis]
MRTVLDTKSSQPQTGQLRHSSLRSDRTPATGAVHILSIVWFPKIRDLSYPVRRNYVIKTREATPSKNLQTIKQSLIVRIQGIPKHSERLCLSLAMCSPDWCKMQPA